MGVDRGYSHHCHLCLGGFKGLQKVHVILGLVFAISLGKTELPQQT